MAAASTASGVARTRTGSTARTLRHTVVTNATGGPATGMLNGVSEAATGMRGTSDSLPLLFRTLSSVKDASAATTWRRPPALTWNRCNSRVYGSWRMHGFRRCGWNGGWEYGCGWGGSCGGGCEWSGS